MYGLVEIQTLVKVLLVLSDVLEDPLVPSCTVGAVGVAVLDRQPVFGVLGEVEEHFRSLEDVGEVLGRYEGV